jgi:hypothetical protein
MAENEVGREGGREAGTRKAGERKGQGERAGEGCGRVGGFVDAWPCGRTNSRHDQPWASPPLPGPSPPPSHSGHTQVHRRRLGHSVAGTSRRVAHRRAARARRDFAHLSAHVTGPRVPAGSKADIPAVSQQGRALSPSNFPWSCKASQSHGLLRRPMGLLGSSAAAAAAVAAAAAAAVAAAATAAVAAAAARPLAAIAGGVDAAVGAVNFRELGLHFLADAGYVGRRNQLLPQAALRCSSPVGLAMGGKVSGENYIRKCCSLSLPFTIALPFSPFRQESIFNTSIEKTSQFLENNI